MRKSEILERQEDRGWDFYVDEEGQIYYATAIGEELKVENLEGTIRIEDQNLFFKSLIRLRNPIEMAVFMLSKLEKKGLSLKGLYLN